MPRRRKDGKKPPRHKAKNLRLRELLPRVGFDFADKRCRAMLSGVNSAAIKDQISAASGDLSKALVDEALASVFLPAIAAMEEDPEKISEMMPGEYWGTIGQTLPWIGGSVSGHTLFALVVALIVAHEKYGAASPYGNFKHQYGKLAEAVHKFSGLLKQHHGDSPLTMSFYFDSSVSLPSDEEDEGEDDDDADEDDGVKDEGQGQGEDEDVDMEDAGAQGEGGELAEGFDAMNLH